MSKEQSGLQVTIDLDDKVALKMLAVQRRTTVSAIVRQWVSDGITRAKTDSTTTSQH